MMSSKILFIFTSANKNLTGGQTGWFLPEAARPYYILAPYHEIDFASPMGPNPPVYEGSLDQFKEDLNFLEDETVKSKFANAKKLSEVNTEEYDAVFYVGGHGPVLDLANDPINVKLASEFYRAGKIMAAICHGPAALVGATDATGRSIFEGKTFTGFSNVEEEQIDRTNSIPFLLEDEIVKLGGIYQKASEPWAPKVVISGHLITGQNPASATLLGEAMFEALNPQGVKLSIRK